MLFRSGKDKDPGIITMLQFIVSAILAWAFTLTQETAGNVQINGEVVFGVLYLGIVCSGLCFLFQTISQKTESPTSVSIILSFENIFGIIFGMVFFNEQMTVNKAIGFVLMFAAILIAELQPSFLKSRKDREREAREKLAS